MQTHLILAAAASMLVTAMTLAADSARAADEPTDFEAALLAPPMDTLYHDRLQVESAGYLSVQLFNVPIDHERTADVSQFTIVSPDDPAYAAERSVRPAVVSSRSRAIRVAERKHLLVKNTAVFLELPEPMRDGMTYEVQIGDIGAEELPPLAPVLFDDRRIVNDNIRINQLGYLPEYAKIAYLGRYMGSGGGMPFDAQQFEVLDAAGDRVHAGAIRRRAVNEELVGQQVYELDFTDFEPDAAAGPYRLFVPNVGVSYAFDVGEAALNPGYANLMRGHYHQRCGMAIDPEHSRHACPACHLDDAYIDEAVENLDFINPENPPLHDTRYGRQQQATGGHHDAGDYGKYTITGAVYVSSLLTAMDVFPDRYREDNLGLPYSDNGIPDLLEEVKWELDWLENMQDPDDGGVFGVIKPNTGGYEQDLPLVEARRFFYPKDTVFTGAYAAALAYASQSPAMREHYPDDADRYLEKAVKAWGWLEQNDRYVQYFHYGAKFGDWDERCWAAVALYAATGEQAYHDYFLEHFEPERKQWGWWPLTGKVGHAVYTYLFMDADRPRDEAMLERCRAIVRESAGKFARESEEHPYRLSMPAESIQHGTYGWYFPGGMFGYNLLMAYAIDGDRSHLEVALHNLHYTMGANPSGYFLQTGLGDKRNIEVVHQIHKYSGVIEPVAGMPLGIGSHGFYWLNRYQRTINEGSYPGDWPLLNRWYDGYNVTTEFTMQESARETIVAGYFASVGEAQRERPRVTVRGDRLVGPAPLAVEFAPEVESAGRIRQVFWDFGDESFSTQMTPTHVFDEPGREYTVAVTVVDEHGLINFDEAVVGVEPESGAMSRTPFRPDADTLLLYRFDGDLRAAGRGPALTPRDDADAAAAFAEAPLVWMAEPAGAALVLDGETQWHATLPGEWFVQDRGLTIEGTMYVRNFTAWGQGGDPLLLGLEQRWDSWFGLKQGTWDQSRAPAFQGFDGTVIESEALRDRFPQNRWVHVKLVYEPPNRLRLYVNGEIVGDGQGRPLNPDRGGDVTLRFGPWDGMIDELRISRGVR